MKREMTCIICPRGCTLQAEVLENGITVTGNTCPKGEVYAITECTTPMRTVTATVRCRNRRNTMISVKTASPIPKEQMMTVMALLRKRQLEAPVNIGDVVLPDIMGTNIIVTKAVQ